MWPKKIKFLLLGCLLGCAADYSVIAKNVEEIVPIEIQVDSYTQPSKPEQVDVLVLLDTSCSMSDNYAQVSAGVELLRNDLNSVTNDYNIAFINTSLVDPYFAGTYDNNTSIIDFIMAPRSLGLDRVEAGFSALYDFTRATPESVMFFRDSADKLFIFISDEDEQSGIPVDVFEDWLKIEFNEVQRDVVSIVTVPDDISDCDSQDYSFTVGHRYIELVQYYGKSAIDICSNWELWLSNSTFLIGPTRYIQLSKEPLEESIKVYINKIETEDWNYLSDANMVYLNTEPRAGDLVEVGYVIYVD